MATVTRQRRKYESPKREEAVARTRSAIKEAVRDALEEGVFQELSVEEIAERAGVSRATVYTHFDSRLALVDAICEDFGANPSMQRIRAAAALEDPAESILEILSASVGFWASEEAIHRGLYGLAVIDLAAADFVRRQRDDRRDVLRDRVAHLKAAGGLRPGVDEADAHALLMVLTSFATYQELRAEGFSRKRIEERYRAQAAAQLLAD